jgi:hypothetical protein
VLLCTVQMEQTILYVGALIFLQFIALYTSIDSFIKPLEKVAHQLKVGGRL